MEQYIPYIIVGAVLCGIGFIINKKRKSRKGGTSGSVGQGGGGNRGDRKQQLK